MDYFTAILRSVWGVSLAVLFFGFTIFIHELGHYLAAKKRGLKVERFSIGFGPRIWGWTGKDGVDYRISLIPLGGYVALPQMADMSAVEGETEDDAEKLPKIGYADKMIVAVMGATFNVLFAIVLACILSIFGRPVLFDDGSTVIGYVDTELTDASGEKFKAPALESKIEVGDKVLEVDGRPVKNFSEVREAVATGDLKDGDRLLSVFTLERNGKPLPEKVKMHPILIDLSGAGDLMRTVGLRGATPVYISVGENSTLPAARAGLKNKDRLISINGTEILSFEQFKDSLVALGANPATIVYERKVGKETVRNTVVVTPEIRTVTRPLLAVDFTENGVKRHVEFVPVPAKLALESWKEPRTRLVVRRGLPADSAYATQFASGNEIESVDIQGGKTFRPGGDYGALLAATRELGADKSVSFYMKGASASEIAAVSGVSFSEIPAEKQARIGIGPGISPYPDKQAPWVYIADTFNSTFNTLKSLLSPRSDVGVKHLTGVIGISRIYYTLSDNIMGVVWITIVLNINLAVMNLLPLPVLDGGHMVYATIEKLRGKPLPRRVIEYVQVSFVVLLFGLMAFVIWRDISRLRANGDQGRQAVIEEFVAADPEPAKPVAK